MELFRYSVLPADEKALPITVEMLLTIVTTMIASSGFWAFFQHRLDRNSRTTKLMIGIAHVQIVQTGLFYIDRGWISLEEYDDFHQYLYRPYEEIGANGLAEKIFDEVKALPTERKWKENQK